MICYSTNRKLIPGACSRAVGFQGPPASVLLAVLSQTHWGQSSSVQRPSPAPHVDKVWGLTCLILPGPTAASETLAALSVSRAPFLCPHVVSKRGALSLLYLKPLNALPSRPNMEQALPTPPASSLSIQPTSHAEHASGPLHVLFPLLPSAFPHPLCWVSSSLSLGLNLMGASSEAPSWWFCPSLLHSPGRPYLSLRELTVSVMMMICVTNSVMPEPSLQCQLHAGRDSPIWLTVVGSSSSAWPMASAP